jgi:hypothetical protein
MRKNEEFSEIILKWGNNRGSIICQWNIIKRGWNLNKNSKLIIVKFDTNEINTWRIREKKVIMIKNKIKILEEWWNFWLAFFWIMIRELFFNFYEKNNIEESFDNSSKNNYALYDYLLILKKNI